MKAIVNAKILTMEEKVYEKGSILIDGKKIEKVGKDMEIPQGIEIIDASKKIIMPGLIDGHTHLGIGEEDIGWAGRDYNETTDPITPQLSALDAINPQDNGFSDAYKNGVTTVMVAPGSANVIGGECTVLKTYGNNIDKMVIKENVGLKAALGENPKGVYGDKDKTPSTRMAVAGLLRKALIDAKNYLAQKNLKIKENESQPFDIKMEKIVKVIKKEIPLRVHAHRSDDIMTALRIAKEFDINIIIEHCTEGHLIANEINSANIPVMVGPSFGGRSKVELKNKSFKTAGILNKSGVKVAIISDHSVTPTQHLPLYAALSIKAGMNKKEALKAITLNPAEIIGIDHLVGSIAVGKHADLVIFDKNPLDVMANVEKVFINGKEIS